MVDGLVALYGSPNLTHGAWRKVVKDMEIAQVATDVSTVVDLNNRYFSRHWAKLNTEFDPLRPGVGSGWSYELPTGHPLGSINSPL